MAALLPLGLSEFALVVFGSAAEQESLFPPQFLSLSPQEQPCHGHGVGAAPGCARGAAVGLTHPLWVLLLKILPRSAENPSPKLSALPASAMCFCLRAVCASRASASTHIMFAYKLQI